MSDDNVTEWESGKPETPCGKGSRLAETELIREWLPDIAERFEIKSISDVGCGDQNWIHKVDWTQDVEYTGFDVYPRYSDVIPFDITMEVLPKTDAVLCIYVLNHLRPKAMARALRLMVESGSRYLITSYNTFDRIPFRILETIPHKDTGRHSWSYGVFELNED
jgi:hypothetical protein